MNKKLENQNNSSNEEDSTAKIFLKKLREKNQETELSNKETIEIEKQVENETEQFEQTKPRIQSDEQVEKKFDFSNFSKKDKNYNLYPIPEKTEAKTLSHNLGFKNIEESKPDSFFSKAIDKNIVLNKIDELRKDVQKLTQFNNTTEVDHLIRQRTLQKYKEKIARLKDDIRPIHRFGTQQKNTSMNNDIIEQWKNRDSFNSNLVIPNFFVSTSQIVDKEKKLIKMHSQFIPGMLSLVRLGYTIETIDKPYIIIRNEADFFQKIAKEGNINL